MCAQLILFFTDVAAMAANYKEEDPHPPKMVEKYGAPGKTDADGFDPYTDTVGPGIYGGIVKRDRTGKIVIGRQYQNHNPQPGPVYAGGGYAKSIEALKSPDGLFAIISLSSSLFFSRSFKCQVDTHSKMD